MSRHAKMPHFERKQFLLACAIITLFAMGVIAAVVIATANHTKPAPTAPSAITATGNLTCLPHKNAQPGQPQTLECAIGLKTDDGRYYNLTQMVPQDSMTPFTKRVTITGDVTPPAADDRYDSRGNIAVKTFEAK